MGSNNCLSFAIICVQLCFCVELRVAHLSSFLCCVVFICFVCLNLVSCATNVASVPGLSTLDCTFGFL